MEKSPALPKATELSSSPNFNIHCDAIKAKSISGDYIRVINYPESQRQQVIGAIETLKGELAIVTGWKMLRQSYLSETRTFTRRHYIPEFLCERGVL
jgi:hypothetical protein